MVHSCRLIGAKASALFSMCSPALDLLSDSWPTWKCKSDRPRPTCPGQALGRSLLSKRPVLRPTDVRPSFSSPLSSLPLHSFSCAFQRADHPLLQPGP